MSTYTLVIIQSIYFCKHMILIEIKQQEMTCYYLKCLMNSVSFQFIIGYCNIEKLTIRHFTLLYFVFY